MKSDIISTLNSKKARERMARGVIASLFGMFVMACSGCGGGGSGASTPTASADSTVKSVAIAAEGDSTTYGEEVVNGVAVQTPNNAPAELQIDLQAAFGDTVTVENHGVRGATLAQILNGTSTTAGDYAQPFALAIKSEAAQVITVNFAINDSNPVNDESPAIYQNLLLQLISTARAAGKIVVLEEPNPVVGDSALANYVTVIDQVATQMNLPLVEQYAYIQTLPNWQAMLTDGVHPNDALYKIKAAREAAIIGPIVQKLL